MTSLYCLKLSSHLYPALPWWGGEGRCLFLAGHSFGPSYTPGPSVRAAAWLHHSVLTGAWVGVQLSLQPPPLAFLPSCPLAFSNFPTFRYPDGWLFHACFCVEQELLCSDCPTCKFKGWNNGSSHFSRMRPFLSPFTFLKKTIKFIR